MTIYQILWYFIIYAFIGWVTEVVFHAVTLGKIINRGFLNGPVCPIYGWGMLGVLSLLNFVTQNGQKEADLLFVFAGGMMLATAVELFGGWILDVIFHAKWWDYSDKPFNFHGYICLEFSILWGLGIVLVIEALHPAISHYTAAALPEKYGWPVLAVLYAVFVADSIVTNVMLHNMNKEMAELEQIRSGIRKVSDSMTDVIAGTSIAVAQKIEESQVQAALGKAELKENMETKKTEYRREMELKKAELQKKADELSERMLKNPLIGAKRIIRAFPDMKSSRYAETFENLKKRLTQQS